MSRIEREYDNIRLTAAIRQVPQRTDAILNTILPDVLTRSRTYAIEVLDETNGEAAFRAFDAPVRTAPRPQGERRVGSLPPLGESMILSENDTLGIYERALAGDYDEQVDGQIYDDAGRLVRRVLNRMERARGQVLSTGSMTISEEGGLNLVAPMGVPAANLPGGDASTTAALAWSDPAADILGELFTLQERSRDEVGVELTRAICSSQTIRQMMLNDGIRGRLAVNGSTPDLASIPGLTAALQADGLPAPVRYDYQVAGARVIDAERVVLVPNADADDFGRTEWGTTAEALELDMATNEAPGIVGLVMKSEEPVQVKTKVSALGMPVLNDARKLYVFDTTP